MHYKVKTLCEAAQFAEKNLIVSQYCEHAVSGESLKDFYERRIGYAGEVGSVDKLG